MDKDKDKDKDKETEEDEATVPCEDPTCPLPYHSV